MAERETLEVDVLIVGAGPGGLSAALRLAQMQKAKGGDPLSIAVIEKAPRGRRASAVGRAARSLDAARISIPDFAAKGAPLGTPVDNDNIYFLTETGKLRLPITPPPFQNHGNYIISLSRFTKWLAAQVEAEGIDLFWGFPAARPSTTASASSACAPAIAASARTASRRAPSSPAPTFTPRSRSSPTACAATSPSSSISDSADRHRRRAGAVCDRHQGTVGDPEGSTEAGHRHPHARLSAA